MTEITDSIAIEQKAREYSKAVAYAVSQSITLEDATPSQRERYEQQVSDAVEAYSYVSFGNRVLQQINHNETKIASGMIASTFVLPPNIQATEATVNLLAEQIEQKYGDVTVEKLERVIGREMAEKWVGKDGFAVTQARFFASWNEFLHEAERVENRMNERIAIEQHLCVNLLHTLETDPIDGPLPEVNEKVVYEFFQQAKIPIETAESTSVFENANQIEMLTDHAFESIRAQLPDKIFKEFRAMVNTDSIESAVQSIIKGAAKINHREGLRKRYPQTVKVPEQQGIYVEAAAAFPPFDPVSMGVITSFMLILVIYCLIVWNYQDKNSKSNFSVLMAGVVFSMITISALTLSATGTETSNAANSLLPLEINPAADQLLEIVSSDPTVIVFAQTNEQMTKFMSPFVLAAVAGYAPALFKQTLEHLEASARKLAINLNTMGLKDLLQTDFAKEIVNFIANPLVLPLIPTEYLKKVVTTIDKNKAPASDIPQKTYFGRFFEKFYSQSAEENTKGKVKASQETFYSSGYRILGGALAVCGLTKDIVFSTLNVNSIVTAKLFSDFVAIVNVAKVAEKARFYGPTNGMYATTSLVGNLLIQTQEALTIPFLTAILSGPQLGLMVDIGIFAVVTLVTGLIEIQFKGNRPARIRFRALPNIDLGPVDSIVRNIGYGIQSRYFQGVQTDELDEPLPDGKNVKKTPHPVRTIGVSLLYNSINFVSFANFCLIVSGFDDVAGHLLNFATVVRLMQYGLPTREFDLLSTVFLVANFQTSVAGLTWVATYRRLRGFGVNDQRLAAIVDKTATGAIKHLASRENDPNNDIDVGTSSVSDMNHFLKNETKLSAVRRALEVTTVNQKSIENAQDAMTVLGASTSELADTINIVRNKATAFWLDSTQAFIVGSNNKLSTIKGWPINDKLKIDRVLTLLDTLYKPSALNSGIPNTVDLGNITAKDMITKMKKLDESKVISAITNVTDISAIEETDEFWTETYWESAFDQKAQEISKPISSNEGKFIVIDSNNSDFPSTSKYSVFALDANVALRGLQISLSKVKSKGLQTNIVDRIREHYKKILLDYEFIYVSTKTETSLPTDTSQTNTLRDSFFYQVYRTRFTNERMNISPLFNFGLVSALCEFFWCLTLDNRVIKPEEIKYAGQGPSRYRYLYKNFIKPMMTTRAHLNNSENQEFVLTAIFKRKTL